MADAIKATKALHIEVEQISGTGALVSPRWWRWVDVREAAQTGAAAYASYGRNADAYDDGDASHGHAQPAKCDDLAMTVCGDRGDPVRS